MTVKISVTIAMNVSDHNVTCNPVFLKYGR